VISKEMLNRYEVQNSNDQFRMLLGACIIGRSTSLCAVMISPTLIRRTRLNYVRRGSPWGVCIMMLGLCLALPLSLLQAAPEPVSLPALHTWKTDACELKAAGDATELGVPQNYDIGRAVSPPVAVRAGELATFSAEVKTQYGNAQQSFYRCWLEVEFLNGKNDVVATAASPEIVGTQATASMLAVTALAPPQAKEMRVAVCAQNKMWAVVENLATVSGVKLLQLGGRGEEDGVLKMEAVAGLPPSLGARSAKLAVLGGWPDGTALAITSSRGRVPYSVQITGGRAEVLLEYGAGEVGDAAVTATVFGDSGSLFILEDPMAAKLRIESITADTFETPALVQLTQSETGTMLPGRYQASMPGIFMKAPWSMDLAPGTWTLKVRRGPEFRVLERTLEVKAGQKVSLGTLTLERNVNPGGEGWYAGDADGDVYHGERIYTDISASTAAEIAQAMGLAWVGAGSWGSPTPRTWGEARTLMKETGGPNLLFLWTDEKPKGGTGHACFVGMERPDGDPFGWGWSRTVRKLRNFETLKMIRSSGGATFANHPLRWWMSSGRFVTNMYSTLPFDLCAAGYLDGYNVNEKPGDIMLWSMLLDHGYRVAATTGADFGLDRPAGPVPGKWRMYCYCPDVLSSAALAKAVRANQTVVTNGPVLLADVDGQPPGTLLKSGQAHKIRARAWARADEPDDLQRLELWSHGKVIATQSFAAGTPHAEHTFTWEPAGDWDWVAVRVLTRQGWAITSAFYASSPAWKAPQPVQCEVTLAVSGLDAGGTKGATVEVWDGVPGVTGTQKTKDHPLSAGATITVPITSTLVVRTSDGRRKDFSLYDAAGMPEYFERIASGREQERPLLDWRTYEEVLKKCEKVTVKVDF